MLSLLLGMALIASAPQFEVQTLDGRTLTGSIEQLSPQQLTLQTADGPTSLALAELMSISAQQASPATTESPITVEMTDGSRLPAREYVVGAGKAKITLGGGQIIETSTRTIASVRFQLLADAVEAEWLRIAAQKRDTDLLVVHKGDSIDYHRGALRDVSDQVVQFDLDGEALPVKRAKVCGLIYWQTPAEPLPEAVCHVSDSNGAVWSVRSLALPGDLQWTTPAGLTSVQPLGNITKIDFSQGRVVFLSDLKPESVSVVPLFGAEKDLPVLAKFYAPRNDKNLEAGPLQLDGKRFHKGVTLHSRTRIVYRLPDRFRRLQATAAIEDSVRPLGHVRLVIQGDDKVLLDTAIAGTDPPKPLDLDLEGVRRLTIVADFGENLSEADHLGLGEARIIK